MATPTESKTTAAEMVAEARLWEERGALAEAHQGRHELLAKVGAREPAVVCDEEAVVDESVEVEGRQAPADSRRLRCLVPPRPLGP